MNIYAQKFRWKFGLFIMAILIGIGSLYYTNSLVKDLAEEERKKVELWAEATERIVQTKEEKENFSFLLKIIQNNTTVPVIVVDSAENILMSRNLDTLKVNNKAFMKKRLKSMKEAYDPIVINLPGNNFQRIYYDRSTTLNKLTYYPYVQLGVILLFILVAYLAFDASRKAEQNQVWIGLTKETAHQLGTPISSLLAWFEMLKTQDVDPQIINELSKDINRLEVITERFSKVGSKPKLALFNIYDVLYESIHYIRTRTSKKLDITCQEPEDPMYVPLNKSLFAWVIENVCKNSIDAMNGAGKIDIRVQDNMQVIYIDIHDNGKGIPKTKFKSIFKPGYTTKNRGWGLGLSLSKRIVEEYHNGKIFVQSSETGEGTIMRIVLKKFHSHK